MNELNAVSEGSTVSFLNISEIEQQVSTAHKYPRSIKKFRDETLQMVTLNESVAGECIYSLPRKEYDRTTGQFIVKNIEGASARFAEVVASAWGNSRVGARVISDNGEFITAQGVFHDLEKNVAITYEVQRRVIDSKGKRYKPDMITVTANAACSIALRNAVLKGVPKAFWSDMYQAARATVMGDLQTLNNRRSAAVKAFQQFGVSLDQICATLGISGIEDIGLEHLVTLRGMLTAIKDGDTTPEEAFSQVVTSSKNESVKPELPELTEEEFNDKCPAWMDAIESGKKSTKQVISMLKSKYALTKVQTDTIESWGKL